MSNRLFTEEKIGQAHLLGLGLDNGGEHKRITQGESFTVLGGSEETHEKMMETLMRTFECLKRKDLTLEELDVRQLGRLLAENLPE